MVRQTAVNVPAQGATSAGVYTGDWKVPSANDLVEDRDCVDRHGGRWPRTDDAHQAVHAAIPLAAAAP